MNSIKYEKYIKERKRESTYTDTHTHTNIYIYIYMITFDSRCGDD